MYIETFIFSQHNWKCFLLQVETPCSIIPQQIHSVLHYVIVSLLSVFRPDVPHWYIPILFYILGPIHLIMSVMVVIEYFLINFPHFKLPQFFYTTWLV